MIVLAGDVGGTKTDLGLLSFAHGDARPDVLVQRRYPSAEHEGLEAICEMFLREAPARPEVAGFGIAGPIVSGRVRATNLPWVIERDALASRVGCPVTLVNDLEATAQGIDVLAPGEIHTLSEGEESPFGARAIIAAGTGLGEGYMVYDQTRGRHIAAASEGGHSDFGPRGTDEVALLAWLSERYDHVSVERVVSGMGIEDLFAWLVSTGRYTVPTSFAGRPAAAAISEAALAGAPPICVATMRQFVVSYGAEAGNLALKIMALGGVYLGGGIAPKILPLMTDGSFLNAFCDKGRFAPLLRRMPVRVILNDQTALLGAAIAATWLRG